MPEPMLEIKGVTAGYGRSMVLFDVDVTIPRGGGAAIMGHNGAGKTTLLRVAVGLVPVKSGAVPNWATELRLKEKATTGSRLRFMVRRLLMVPR